MCDVDCTILIEYLCERDQSRSWTRFLWRLILKLFMAEKSLIRVAFAINKGILSILVDLKEVPHFEHDKVLDSNENKGLFSTYNIN